MRVVLGVREQTLALSVIEALLQLNFENLNLFPTHVLEHIGKSFGKFMLTATEAEYYGEYMRMERQKADALLDAFEQELLHRGLKGSCCLKVGNVGNELIKRVKEVDGDLLALGLDGFETLGHKLFGAVGRKLVLQCPSSFFVFKSFSDSQTIRRAVFATDHSVYANSALDRLISWRPQGLESLTVLTAYPEDLVRAMSSVVTELKVDVKAWIEQKLAEENQKLADKLLAQGIKARIEIRGEPVHEAIAASMRQSEAGLLILGAHGHGLLEGLALGSVAAHQVLATPHNVMVIRP